MKKLLEMHGFIVHAVADPICALGMFNKGFSLVLSDISLKPKISGFDFAKRISDVIPHVKVLLMTALDIDPFEFRKFVSSAQVDGFIQKPISINKLVSIIERYLAKGSGHTDKSRLQQILTLKPIPNRCCLTCIIRKQIFL